MKARALAGVAVLGMLASACAAVLGLDSGNPIGGSPEGGADATLPPAEAAADAPFDRNAGDGGLTLPDGACAPGTKSCSGCQSPSDPAFGCSATGCSSCSQLLDGATQVAAFGCDARGCTIAKCATDFIDCDNNPANGCEANVQTDPAHCGGCANKCAFGEFCAGGNCSADCGAPFTKCPVGLCVNTTADPQHCSSCTNVCASPANGTATCSGSICGFTCDTGNGFNKCSDGCFRTQTDPTHCGAGCMNCNAPPNAMPFCNGGSFCDFNCMPGYVRSNSSCVPIDAGQDAGADGACQLDAPSCNVPGNACSRNDQCCTCGCAPMGFCCFPPGAQCNPAMPQACCNGRNCVQQPTLDGAALYYCM